MFAGHAAAEFDAFAEDLVARFEDSFDLFGVAFVEQQDRVDVAVSRVKDVDDAETVSLPARDDELQNLRQLGAWNNAVLSAVARTESADRAECLLATLPEQQPFLLRVRLPHFAGTAEPLHRRRLRDHRPQ